MEKTVKIMLFCLLTINKTTGQSFEKIIEVLSSYKTIGEFKSKAPNYKDYQLPEFNGLDTTIFSQWVTREIGFGFQQYRNNFTANDSKGNPHDYWVTCIIYKDSIVLGYVEEFRDYFLPIRILPKKVFRLDNQYLNEYIEERKRVFKRQIKVNQLLADLRKDLTIEFGCGEAGQSYSKEYKKMVSFVENRNKERLNKWLRSANCELQVYGAMGLLGLQKKGINLTDEEKQIIEFLIKQDSKITYCGGCLYGLSGTFSKMIKQTE